MIPKKHVDHTAQHCTMECLALGNILGAAGGSRDQGAAVGWSVCPGREGLSTGGGSDILLGEGGTFYWRSPEADSRVLYDMSGTF